MSFVCVICEDFLTVDGDGGPPNPIVTTTCGHVYHQKCIHDWFEAKLRNNAREENHGRQLDNSEKCPTCQKDTSSEELIRIFPTEEIENNEQVDSSMGTETEGRNPKTRAQLLAENKKLREELKRIETCRLHEQQNWFALFEDMRLENETKVRALQSQLDSHLRSRNTTPQELSTLVEEETPNELTTRISVPRVPPQRTRIIRNSLSVKPLETTMGGLKSGDMVVWPSPEENHNGRVTWIGIVDNVIFAAVLCDDPIGNTDGVINEKLRFECNPEYTRLIPVRELILQEDFYPPAVNQGAETTGYQIFCTSSSPS